jgi:hypothetical protein
LPLTDLTDYVRYLRIESYNNEILHYQEVKWWRNLNSKI